MIAIHIVKNSEGNYRSITKLRTKIELKKKNKTITHKIFTPKVETTISLWSEICAMTEETEKEEFVGVVVDLMAEVSNPIGLSKHEKV